MLRKEAGKNEGEITLRTISISLTEVLCIVSVLSLLVTGYNAQRLGAAERSKMSGPMTNTGVDADASGKFKASLRESKSNVSISLRNLNPSTTYSILVDGINAETFDSDDRGRARLRYRTDRDPLLTFDPRGAVLTINDGSADLLEVDLSGSTASSSVKVDERTSLQPEVSGRAEVRYGLKRGLVWLRIDLKDVPSDDYAVYVDGALQANIAVPSGKSRGRLQLAYSSSEAPLDFDVLGKEIAIVGGDGLLFSGDLESNLGVGDPCRETEINARMLSIGSDPKGQADARFRIRNDCDRDFRVEIEDVPEGVYDLTVDGEVRGTITVVTTADEVEGEIEFDTAPDDPDEQLLDFDPRGKTIIISAGTTVFFIGRLGENGGVGSPTECVETETEVPLFNLGMIGGAKGEARFRDKDDCDQDFQVEIEDVPLGEYELQVGGVTRGTITVMNMGGENEGELRFDTDLDGQGELPLDFDPRGKLIQVLQDGTPILERTFPQE